MKKIFILALFFFLSNSVQATVLEAGVSIEHVPKALYGSWRVNAKLDETNSPISFRPQSIDFWNISRETANFLNMLVKMTKAKRVLEIGCGTGFLTSQICNNLSLESFVAVDIVEECEEYVHKISQDIIFIPADIEAFLKENRETFDLIISNASLTVVFCKPFGMMN